jgi:hypothetical protein
VKPRRKVFLYVGSLVRNHWQTCSNCLPRTLGSGSRRANRSLNAPTAGMLIEGCGCDWSIQHDRRSTGKRVVTPNRHGDAR